jgi:CRISPR-associated endonuclease/helicase Cas3
MTSGNCTLGNVKKLWAKSCPRHPLWKHMLDAAAVSFALYDSLRDFPLSKEQTAFLVGLHDIGKADPFFQHQTARNSSDETVSYSDELEQAGFKRTADVPCRHERISAEFIRQWLLDQRMAELTAYALARAVVAHHGYWNDVARSVPEKYVEAQKELCRMLQSVLDLTNFPNKFSEEKTNLSDLGMRLAGHVVLCDWIASNEGFLNNDRLKNVEDPQEYFDKAKKVAKKWVRCIGLERHNWSGKPTSVVENPRPIQQRVLEEDISPGLVIIEAPMGEGKTEAAWILAEKWRDKGYHGMYVALPTMATSESLYVRYRDDYLKKMGSEEDVKLVHGMAWLRDDEEPEKPPAVGEPGDDRSLAAAWFRPTRRAMLAAHGVGTVDQAMLAGMNVKFGFLRLYGLADRVLVIDEVHAYDAYMSAIICRLLNWCACLKIPVVMLSATLSTKQRKAMIEAYGALSPRMWG